MGDIVLAAPKTIDVPTRYVPLTTEATRCRVVSWVYGEDSTKVRVEWINADGRTISAEVLKLEGAEHAAIGATLVDAADAGKTLGDMVEKRIRRAVKQKLALEGTTP